MPIALIWFVVIILIIMKNKKNKKQVTKSVTSDMNSRNTAQTHQYQKQTSVKGSSDTTSNKMSMAQKKKQLQEHFGMPSGRIHDEIHGEKHIHDQDSVLCRANINNDNKDIKTPKEFENLKSVLPDTETLIICGYNGQEFLDSLQNEFNKKFPV